MLMKIKWALPKLLFVVFFMLFIGCKEEKSTPDDAMARNDEKPKHKVEVPGFWMDSTEVTNAQFKRFVEETNYLTTAERKVDWEELKKQLPADVIKPHDSLLQPGSLSFQCKHHAVENLNDYSQWWEYKIGANWKHPEGKGSSIEEKDNYPVVHISYEDALAYCKWANKRLPTEAEWEYAALGGLKKAIYPWGNDGAALSKNANTWQGKFPTENSLEDGFERSAPVKSFPANGYGLYDIAGNVWEWTQDWYDHNYYKKLPQSEVVKAPTGPKESMIQGNPNSWRKTIRGGSFLCNDSYCASYRVSARMASSIDTGLEHLGFRTVMNIAMATKDEQN